MKRKVGRKLPVTEQERKEIIEFYAEYCRAYDVYLKAKRTIKEQSIYGLARRYGISIMQVRNIVGSTKSLNLKRFDLTKIRHEKARQVLELRGKGCTLEEVGNQLGFSRERARQLQVKGLKDLTSGQ